MTVTIGVLGVKSLVKHDLKVKNVESVPFSSYFHFCSVLHYA